MNTTLTLSNNKALASGVKLDENNKIVCSIATISDAILNLEKSKDKADYGIAVLINTLSNINNDVFKSLDVSFVTADGKTVNVDNWTKYCKYRFDYSQSHCSKMKRVADKFFTLSDSADFLQLKANDNEYINTSEDSKLAIVANTGAVNVLKDAFGYAFNISQLQELLTYSAEEIADAIEKCLITSASKTISGADSIREIMKANYKPTASGADGAGGADGADSASGADGADSADNTTAYTVENNDKARLSTVLSILESIEDENIKSSDFTSKFIKYVNATIANI